MECKEELLKALRELEYLPLLPVQEKALPVITAHHSLFLQAKTGSGKTAAYLIPVIEMTEPLESEIRTLIIAPTRELALQIHAETVRLAAYARIRTACLIGGEEERKQVNSLKNCAIVTGTPGKLRDLAERGILDLSSLERVIFDEADQIHSPNQTADVEKLLTMIPEGQRICVSATLNDRLKAYLPEQYETIIEDKGWNDQIQSYYLLCRDRRKALWSFLKHTDIKTAIVFVRHRSEAGELASLMKKDGILASAFSAFYDEKTRRKILEQLKKGSIRVLCATDAAARGLDIRDVSHIIHYDLPEDIETLIHRSGRSGHRQDEGISVTLLQEGTENRVALYVLDHGRPWPVSDEHRFDLSTPLAKKQEAAVSVRTIRINAGKKDRIRPKDIAGALSSIMPFSAVGVIEIQETYTSVTILDPDVTLPEFISVKGKNRRIFR